MTSVVHEVRQSAAMLVLAEYGEAQLELMTEAEVDRLLEAKVEELHGLNARVYLRGFDA